MWFRKDSGAWKIRKIAKNRFREAKIGYERPKMRLREAPGAEKIGKSAALLAVPRRVRSMCFFIQALKYL